MSLMLVAGVMAAGCTATGLRAETPLRSPWDLHPVKVRQEGYSCPSTQPLAVDITASDYYSDAKHSIPDPKRQAAYNEVKAQYATVTRDAEKAADKFQQTGDAAAAACVMRILETQAQANAMTGRMSSNQAQYVQNWTMGALAVTYLKVRSAGADVSGTPAETASVQAWMKKVGQQVEDYFQERREKKKTDGQNNHLYWAGFAVMSVGIATDDRSLYEWGISTYKDGVDRIQPDGTLPLEMARGQKALHYHLFALAPLVTMAALGEANGDDLYAYDHDALHRLVSRSLAGLADSRYFTVKAGAKQDMPVNGVIKPGDVDWVLPYVDRFPDPEIRALLQKAGMRPDGYLGGLPPS
jgi:poly(beta-D-mannuronate) lyase